MTAMRHLIAIVAIGGCASPTDTGSDPRTPFIPNPAAEDQGESGNSYPAPLSPAAASVVPIGDPDGYPLHPWVDPGPHEELPVFDCSKVPDEPIEVNELDKPRGYHDVIFDTEGNLIGSDGHNLVAAPDDS